MVEILADGKWYHFDDSYVSPAQASEAVVSDHARLRSATNADLLRRMPTHICCSTNDAHLGHWADRVT